jgi:hypothetical protein
MIRTRIDSKEINHKLGNAVSFSYGFLEGIDLNQILFNQRLGEYTVDALGMYIDAMARGNPDALHHVYEWGAVGQEGGRLFTLKSKASKRVIHFEGKFLQSRTTADNATEPFSDKANVMENAIAVTITPKNSSVLAFEDDGEMVFTRNAIHIEHPGGDAVAGSFGRTVDDFFTNYFTNHLLKPFIGELSKAGEFAQYFPQGVKGGRPVGIKAGIAYLNSAGAALE